MKKFWRFIVDILFLAIAALAILFSALYITQEDKISDLFATAGTQFTFSYSDVVVDSTRIVAWVTIALGSVTFLSIVLSMILFWRRANWSWTIFNLIFVIIILGFGIYVTYYYFDISDYNTVESLKRVFS